MDNIELSVNLDFQQLVDIIKRLSPSEKMEINQALWENDSLVPEEQQELVLDRIGKSKEDPSRLLNWKTASENLKP